MKRRSFIKALAATVMVPTMLRELAREPEIGPYDPPELREQTIWDLIEQDQKDIFFKAFVAEHEHANMLLVHPDLQEDVRKLSDYSKGGTLVICDECGGTGMERISPTVLFPTKPCPQCKGAIFSEVKPTRVSYD